MSAPVIVRSNYSDLFGSSMLPVLEEMFKSEWEQHPSRRSQLFKEVKTDRDIYQSSEMHDLALFNAIAEGTDYSYVRPRQGASKTLTISKYGLGFSISKEAVEDGKFDMIADSVKRLAKSARESQEIQAMDIFNNGFSSVTTADGVALFSASHTLPSGGTIRNILSSAADLSQSSLDTMLKDFETQFVGDSGIIYNIRPKKLLVAPDNKRYARELVGSELKPDSADNNLNSLKDEGLSVISSPHLTDSDAWFLLGEAQDTGLRIVKRKDIETASEISFDNDAIKYKCSYREIIGALHPMGVMGTAGA
jgi:hypothetical protein